MCGVCPIELPRFYRQMRENASAEGATGGARRRGGAEQRSGLHLELWGGETVRGTGYAFTPREAAQQQQDMIDRVLAA